MKNQISTAVIGGGWLGLPLASYWSELYPNKLHWYSRQNLHYLEKKKAWIRPGQLLREKENLKSILLTYSPHFFLPSNCLIERKNNSHRISFLALKNQDFFKSNVLLISIPPGRKTIKQNPYGFKSIIYQLTQDINKLHRQAMVVFLSSTSVYGEKNGSQDETSFCQPEKQSGKVLLWAEEFLSRYFSRLLVLRLGGLFGKNREVRNFFSKKISNQQKRWSREQLLSPVNLIHQTDAIHFIGRLIENYRHQKSFYEIYNLVHPDHPSRGNFYLNDKTKPSGGKLILSQKLLQNIRIKPRFNFLKDY